MLNDEDLRSRYRHNRRDYTRPPSPRPQRLPRNVDSAIDPSTIIPATNPPSLSKDKEVSYRRRKKIVSRNSSAERVRYLISSRRASLIIPLVLIILGLAGIVGYKTTRSNQEPPLDRNQSSTAQVKPEFKIYYPNEFPSGLSIDKTSIKSSKSLFSYNLKQDNQTRLYVTQQPVDKQFSFESFKSKLISPKMFEIDLGQGVIGGLGASLVTALRTRDNTLIIINCINTVCSTPSKALLDSMQPATFPLPY